MERIKFDKVFWEGCEAKLKSFYYNFYLKELVRSNDSERRQPVWCAHIDSCIHIFLKVMFQFEFVLHVHILRWNKTLM